MGIPHTHVRHCTSAAGNGASLEVLGVAFGVRNATLDYYSLHRWPNSLVVGLLAEWFVAARILKGTTLVALMNEPGPNWRRLVALALTVPVALLGGLIWIAHTKRHPSVPSGELSDVATEQPPQTVD